MSVYIVVIPSNISSFFQAQSYVVTNETAADIIALVNSSKFLPPGSPKFAHLFVVGSMAVAGIRDTERISGYPSGQTFIACTDRDAPNLVQVRNYSNQESNAIGSVGGVRNEKGY